MKRFLRISWMLLVSISLLGCGLFGAEDGDTQAASSDSGNAPLTFSDPEQQTKTGGSVMYLSIDGETQELELVGLVQSGGFYSVMDWARDVRNNRLASVSLLIPVRGQAGDQFTEADAYSSGGGASVQYTDRHGNQYAMFTISQAEKAAEYGMSGMEYREGSQFVIAIDDVSTDGNVISGRLIATFSGSNNNKSDDTIVTIDESSFVFDVREGTSY